MKIKSRRTRLPEAQALLEVELAKLQLDMYMDPDNGTSKLDVETIERQIEDQRNQILEFQTGPGACQDPKGRHGGTLQVRLSRQERT